MAFHTCGRTRRVRVRALVCSVCFTVCAQRVVLLDGRGRCAAAQAEELGRDGVHGHGQHLVGLQHRPAARDHRRASPQHRCALGTRTHVLLARTRTSRSTAARFTASLHVCTFARSRPAILILLNEFMLFMPHARVCCPGTGTNTINGYCTEYGLRLGCN